MAKPHPWRLRGFGSARDIKPQSGLAAAGEPPRVLQQVKVYSEPGRFAGWPANHGIWSWGDEILVGFSRGYDKDNGADYHIDPDRPEDFLLARSKDGGATWSIEEPSRPGRWWAREACGTRPCPRASRKSAPRRSANRSISLILISRWLYTWRITRGAPRAFISPMTAAKAGAGHSDFPCSASEE